MVSLKSSSRRWATPPHTRGKRWPNGKGYWALFMMGFLSVTMQNMGPCATTNSWQCIGGAVLAYGATITGFIGIAWTGAGQPMGTDANAAVFLNTSGLAERGWVSYDLLATANETHSTAEVFQDLYLAAYPNATRPKYREGVLVAHGLHESGAEMHVHYYYGSANGSHSFTITVQNTTNSSSQSVLSKRQNCENGQAYECGGYNAVGDQGNGVVLGWSFYIDDEYEAEIITNPNYETEWENSAENALYSGTEFQPGGYCTNYKQWQDSYVHGFGGAFTISDPAHGEEYLEWTYGAAGTCNGETQFWNQNTPGIKVAYGIS